KDKLIGKAEAETPAGQPAGAAASGPEANAPDTPAPAAPVSDQKPVENTPIVEAPGKKGESAAKATNPKARMVGRELDKGFNVDDKSLSVASSDQARKSNTPRENILIQGSDYINEQ